MLENIEYLEKAVAVNISILAQARGSIGRVKDMCADRVLSIRRKQISSENRRKVLHVLNLLRQVKACERVDGQSVGNINQLNETFKSIRELKSLTQVTMQLSERAVKAGLNISKNIFGRVLSYLNAPLSVSIIQRMRDIPCTCTTDGEEFINETILLG